MNEPTFQQAVCVYLNIREDQYARIILNKTLFLRVRLIRPLLSLFFPDYLFNEKRLVEKVGQARDLREIQEEIDFYQHKYVVDSLLKDAFRFRLSGMRLMNLAHLAFREKGDTADDSPSDQSNRSPSP